MKKFKLSAVIASILSLGVVCNSFAFASKEGEEIPVFYEDDPIADLKNSCEYEDDKTLRYILEELDKLGEFERLREFGVRKKLRIFSKSGSSSIVDDFVSLCNDEEHSGEFLKFLYDEMMKLYNEEKFEAAGYMQQIYEAALYNTLYK